MNFFINFPKNQEFEESLKLYIKNEYHISLTFKKVQEKTQNTPKKSLAAFFGNALSNLEYVVIDELGTSVPRILKELGDMIENNIDSEGLFRKSGSCPRQIQVQKSIDKLGRIPSNISFNVFDACGLFKLFFAKLPEPIFPTYLWSTYVKIYRSIQQQQYQKLGGLNPNVVLTSCPASKNLDNQLPSSSTSSSTIAMPVTPSSYPNANKTASNIGQGSLLGEDSQDMLKKQTDALLVAFLFLPYQNINILRYTFNLLNRIAQHSETNKMHAENLATVMTPNFLHDINSLSWKEFIPWIKIITIYINNADKLGWLPQNLYDQYQALTQIVRLIEPNVTRSTTNAATGMDIVYDTPKSQIAKYGVLQEYKIEDNEMEIEDEKPSKSAKLNKIRQNILFVNKSGGGGVFGGKKMNAPLPSGPYGTAVQSRGDLKKTGNPLEKHNICEDDVTALAHFNASKRGGKKHRRSGSLVNGLSVCV